MGQEPRPPRLCHGLLVLVLAGAYYWFCRGRVSERGFPALLVVWAYRARTMRGERRVRAGAAVHVGGRGLGAPLLCGSVRLKCESANHGSQSQQRITPSRLRAHARVGASSQPMSGLRLLGEHRITLLDKPLLLQPSDLLRLGDRRSPQA